jgi:uncharacterized membrane protein
MIKEMMAHHYFLAILLMMVLAVMAVSAIQKRQNQELLKNSNDVTAAIYNMIGVLLALILGFLIVEAYGDYSTASNEAESESTQLRQIYLLAGLFEPADQAKLETSLSKYVDSIRDKEWPLMVENNGGHPETNAKMKELWSTIRSLEIKNDRASAAFGNVINQMALASSLRSQRLSQVQQHIPPPLLYLFVSVAIINVLSVGLFGNNNLKHQRILVAMVTAVLASCIFMIKILDNPYTGPIKIGPESFYLEKSQDAGK